jgi:hypothetical protein
MSNMRKYTFKFNVASIGVGLYCKIKHHESRRSINDSSPCRLGTVMVACLQLDPRFAGSNLAEEMDFKGSKILQYTFL